MSYKNNILMQFLEKPTSRFQLRELARLTKLSTTAVKSALKKLLEENIIKTEKEKHYVFYKVNWDALEYKWAKKFYSINKIFASGLIKYLDEQLNYPEAIVLFGSAARGEDAERSDIDLFVFSVNKKELNLKEFEKKLGKPIMLQLFNKAEFEIAKKKNKELINNVINGVILKGYLEVL
jgi:predicted nucleotidyltransferase